MFDFSSNDDNPEGANELAQYQFQKAKCNAVGAIIYGGFSAYYIFIWPKYKEKKNFLIRLSNDIIGIRNNLRNNELNRNYIPASNDWYLLNYEEKRAIFKSTEEFISVDDFYAKLTDRNHKIKSVNDGELLKCNK